MIDDVSAKISREMRFLFLLEIFISGTYIVYYFSPSIPNVEKYAQIDEYLFEKWSSIFFNVSYKRKHTFCSRCV